MPAATRPCGVGGPTRLSCYAGSVKTSLTITVDAAVLRRARMRASQDDTSVNAFLRACLEDYADEGDRAAQAVARVVRLVGAAELHWGSKTWSREELYER